MGNKVWPAISRTGGGLGALDSISGSLLTIGDGASVFMSTFLGSYVLAASTLVENDPLVIVPDANAGGNVWTLI